MMQLSTVQLQCEVIRSKSDSIDAESRENDAVVRIRLNGELLDETVSLEELSRPPFSESLLAQALVGDRHARTVELQRSQLTLKTLKLLILRMKLEAATKASMEQRSSNALLEESFLRIEHPGNTVRRRLSQLLGNSLSEEDLSNLLLWRELDNYLRLQSGAEVDFASVIGAYFLRKGIAPTARRMDLGPPDLETGNNEDQMRLLLPPAPRVFDRFTKMNMSSWRRSVTSELVVVEEALPETLRLLKAATVLQQDAPDGVEVLLQSASLFARVHLQKDLSFHNNNNA
ncbi:MAG: hypothetical protein MHM6MM_001173 [Cercozoa sp. M6MM]